MASLLRGGALGSALLLLGSTTGGVSIPNTGGNPIPGAITVTPSIVKRSPTQAYPETVHFDVSITGQDASDTVGADGYDARLHEIEYLWDGYYSGSGAYTFTAPTRLYTGSARHTGGHSSNRYQYTPKAAFTYREAGTRTVRVYAYEPSSGKFGFADIDVTVGDQDAAYPGTQTIYLSPGGSFGSAPAGAVQVTSGSIESAITTYVVGASTRRRIMLNAGETFTAPTTAIGTWYGRSIPGLMITKGGAGADPIVTSSARWDYDDRGASTTDKELIFDQLAYSGSFDDTVNTSDGSGEVIRFLGGNTAEYFLMDRCSADGLNSLFTMQTPAGGVTPPDRYLSFNDCDTQNCSFGSLAHHITRYTFTGCRVHSSPNALVNSTTLAGWGDRIQGSVVLYHSCDYFRRQGWTQVGSRYFPQQCLRLNYNSTYTTAGDEYYICASVMESPSFPIYMVDAEGNVENPVNAVFSKNVLLGGWGSDCLITTGSAGLTVRDNLMIMPNLVTKAFNNFKSFLILGGVSTSATNRDAPIRIHNNTLVSYLDGSVNPFSYPNPPTVTVNNNGYTDVTTNNNIIHATRTSPTDSDQGPLLDATNVFSIVDGGYIDSGSLGDQSATYVTTVTLGELDLHVPETTSSAIGTALSGLVSDSDFYGIRRDTILSGLSRNGKSQGSFEPNLES